ncbi:MAG TPA: 16S rRNA (cytosine(967)-C(5))-methyltransferase RsmB [Gammaproteobacteria bacterium]|nr:16S rRNA (cytosine(967)-C(5))-methyltransferase RsmB [Gammaproteobacteria bacterium]
MNPRAAAAKALVQVLEQGRSLDKALPPALAEVEEGSQGLVQELCYGVLRWRLRLEALAARLLHKPVADSAIHALLLVGLYQLLYLRVAAHAAVDQTVAACEALGKPWAKGLINATLRNVLRNSATLLAELDLSDEATYSHPVWLLERLKHDWPEHWPAIVKANNERPPLWLRVNVQRTTREAYMEQLAAAGIKAGASPHSQQAVLLEEPVGVEALPGFEQGLVSVQDAAAQQAALLLGAQPGERILDACAAPGGKTCHILELQPELGELMAVDSDERRSARIRENLTRLGLVAPGILPPATLAHPCVSQVRLVTGDASRPQDWWDGKLFDRILLDAPCSGTGVIRRHPDIKQLRTPADIEIQSRLQQEMLTALWPLLRAGGMLLYVTCSILKRENEQSIQHFLATHPDARADEIRFAWHGQARALVGDYILPGEQGMDGFYYARLRKV